MRFCAVQGFNTAERFFTDLKDGFDVLYAEGAVAPKMIVVGLAQDGALHPAQQALVDVHGSQHGFCTPGFMMSLVRPC